MIDRIEQKDTRMQSHFAYPGIILINADSVRALRRVRNLADHMRPLSWPSIYQGTKIGRWTAMENDFVNTGIENERM